jgi:FkbM family methyltransferase
MAREHKIMEQYYKTYLERFKEPPKNFLEIGSRDALHAEIVQKLADIPDNKMFIVEPHPESFKQIVKNFPQYRSFELAISNQPGVIKFNAIPATVFPDHIVGTSSILSADTEFISKYWGAPHPINWINVLAINGVQLLQLINEPEIDLVKIDVEGFTWEVLISFGDAIRAMKSIHIEVEWLPVWKDQHVYAEVKHLLEFYNFKEMYYIPLYLGGNQGDAVWIRND